MTKDSPLQNLSHLFLRQCHEMTASLGMRLQGEGSSGRRLYQALAHRHGSGVGVGVPLYAAQAVELAESLEGVEGMGEALADYLSRFTHPGTPHHGLEL